MKESRIIIYLFLAVTEFLVGILANGFVVVVNGIDLIKQRKIIPLDLLLFCLAISRIFQQVIILDVTLILLSLANIRFAAEIFAIFIFVNESGIWFATLLGVFYCVKIATIAHPLFLWLKMRISKMVPWLLLGILLYSCSTSIYHGKCTWAIYKDVILSYLSKNVTIQTENTLSVHSAFIFLGITFPLLIFLFSVLFLIYSLWRHTQQMRNTVTVSWRAGKNVHFSALASVFSFLVLYMSHYMTAFVLSSRVFQTESHIFRFFVLVFGAYPCGHSVILILGNSKLRQNAKELLLCRPC